MTGREFRSWRRSQEITQQVVANSVNCNVSTISRWEKGELNLTPLLYEKIINYYEQWRRNTTINNRSIQKQEER